MGIIRLLLALSVVLSHTGPLFGYAPVGGTDAVEAFFIISGFYMALVLNEKYLPRPSAAAAHRVFLESRVLRLFPVYLVVLLAVLGTQALWLARGETFAEATRTGIAPPALAFWAHYRLSAGSAGVLLLTNALLLGQDGVVFLGVHPHTGTLYFTPDFWHSPVPALQFMLIPQTWTLGLELTFYLLAPWLVRRPPVTVAGIGAASLALRLFMHRHGFNHDPWTYRFFPTELCFFLAGALGYRVYKRLQARRPPAWCGRLALAGVLAGILLFNRSPLSEHSGLFFVLFAVALPFIFLLTKSSRADRWVGELSFPLYVVHMLVLQVLHREAPAAGPGPACAASVAVAVALMLLVDQPLEKRRQRWLARRERQPAPARPAAAAAAKAEAASLPSA